MGRRSWRALKEIEVCARKGEQDKWPASRSMGVHEAE